MKNKEAIVRKTRLIGVVTSDAMTNTATVAVSRVTRHPLYKKTIKKSKKYKVHNEMGAKKGDKVLIEETRPISKDKRFVIRKIFEKASTMAPVLQEESDLQLLLSHETKEKETQVKE